MTPERDKEARRVQVRKLKARIEAAGLLDKVNSGKSVTLAVFLEESPKATFALRRRRQNREPTNIIEALTIDPQDTARVICALATNDLRAAAMELLEAFADLIGKDEASDRQECAGYHGALAHLARRVAREPGGDGPVRVPIRH